ncbi:MAG: tol-pal system protein YbgF [Gammaproteobacteria bacterium]|nr:tol-pal system protein YbgF [Gammaproteobacteria bacterium]
MTIQVLNRPVMLRSLTRQVIAVLLLTMITGSMASVFAESRAFDSSDIKNRPLDVRVDRLERLMSSQKQLELLYRMKQLQEENQQLRGLLEDQSNEIRLLKQQQRELYADLNRRLSQMEGGSAQSSDSASVLMNPVESAEQDSSNIQVIDKSTVKHSIYGVTEREEIVVGGDNDKVKKSTDLSESGTASKPPVAVIKPMSEKERKAEQKAYQKAYDELRALRYNKARDSFTQFIQQYPSGRYAHIAQYWVAESSYAQHNYEQAIVDYQLLLDVYPFSPKKAEAELKKAYSYYELGQKQKARRTLDELLITYPDTTEAGQAKRLIKKL